MKSDKTISRCVAIVLTILLGANTLWAQEEPRRLSSNAADAVFYNGKIVTVNERFDIADALAVRNSRIIAVGSEEDAMEFAGPETRMVDLNGNTALPGLYDNHVHLGVENPNRKRVDLSEVQNLEDLQEVLQKYAETLSAGEWIVGSVPHGTGGVEPFPEDNLPTRWDLDAAVADHPIALNRGHLMLVNSLALEKAGINRSTSQPPGGQIDKNEEGEPIGVLRETPARRRITSIIPPPPPIADSTAINSLREQLEKHRAFGKTSINVIGGQVGSGTLRWLQDLYRESGTELPRLTVQVRLSPGYDSYDDPEVGGKESIEELEGLQVHTGFGDERLKLGAIKMSIDGAFSGQSAWTIDSYPGRPDFHGGVRIPKKAFYPVAERAHELGWQLGIHVIGDAATRMVVNSIERILEEHPREDHRHYLHHIEVKPPEETLDKIADLSIIAAMQPNFTYTIAPYLKKVLGGEKLETNSPQKSLAERGIRMSYGTDSLPHNPYVGLFTAVTRRGIDGEVYGPEERMSVPAAIRRYTMGTAYMTFDEDDRGSIEVGKLADLTVLDQDILTIDPEGIKDIQAIMTVIGGEIVYQQSAQSSQQSR